MRAGQTVPLVERFWAKVDKAGECWLWTGYTEQDGYGKLRTGGPRADRRTTLAHRLSYVLAFGAIPAGMQVCHRCDVPACVRPEHLFFGSAVENQLDKVRKGRQAHGERGGRARLTADQVGELRRRFAAGPTNDCHLALEFKVHPTAIRFLRIGKTWRHLPGGPSVPPPLLRTGRPYIVRAP